MTNGCDNQHAMGEATLSRLAVFRNWGKGTPGKASHSVILSIETKNIEGLSGHPPAWANQLNTLGAGYVQPVPAPE